MATEPTSGEPHSSRIASWIGNVDIAGEFFFVCQLILSRIPSPYVVQSDVIIGLALVCALLLACFAAVSRLGLEERACVCVRASASIMMHAVVL